MLLTSLFISPKICLLVLDRLFNWTKFIWIKLLLGRFTLQPGHQILHSIYDYNHISPVVLLTTAKTSCNDWKKKQRHQVVASYVAALSPAGTCKASGPLGDSVYSSPSSPVNYLTYKLEPGFLVHHLLLLWVFRLQMTLLLIYLLAVCLPVSKLSNELPQILHSRSVYYELPFVFLQRLNNLVVML